MMNFSVPSSQILFDLLVGNGHAQITTCSLPLSAYQRLLSGLERTCRVGRGPTMASPGKPDEGKRD